MKRVILSGLTAAVLAAALLTAVSGAHSGRDRLSPSAGSTAPRSLASVSLTYKARIRSGVISVTGPGGNTVSVGKTSLINGKRRMRILLKSNLKAGRYKVRYVTRHTDGDTVRDGWSFRVK